MPACRLRDCAAWFALYRPVVWPHRAHGPPLLYERLLPMLTGRPPRANHGHPCQSLAPWKAPFHAGDPHHGGLVWYAAEHVAPGGVRGAPRERIIEEGTHMLQPVLARW